MSSSDPPDEDLWHNDRPSTLANRLIATVRASWEIQEIVAAAFLLVIAVFALSGLAAGIGSASQNVGYLNGEPVSQVLLESTQWAGAFASFLILCALGLVWWQVDGWAEALEAVQEDEKDADPGDGGGSASDEASETDEAVRHIGRNRVLSTWAGVSLVVTTMSVVAAMVGLGLEEAPTPWVQWASFGGQLVGGLILAAVGFFALVRIRRRCTAALTSALETNVATSPL